MCGGHFPHAGMDCSCATSVVTEGLCCALGDSSCKEEEDLDEGCLDGKDDDTCVDCGEERGGKGAFGGSVD